MVWNKQESRRKYWATRSAVRSFSRTAHSLACSGLLASLMPSAALTHLLARSLRSLPRSWESEFFMSQNDPVLFHSASLLRMHNYKISKSYNFFCNLTFMNRFFFPILLTKSFIWYSISEENSVLLFFFFVSFNYILKKVPDDLGSWEWAHLTRIL